MDPINFDSTGNVILPQPDEIPDKDRNDAMGAYLMIFAGLASHLFLPFLSFIASVIYYFINKKKRFTAFHSYQSLITHIPIAIINGILLIWGVIIIVIVVQQNSYKYLSYFGIYALFVLLWNIIYVIYSIVACVNAYKGRFFYMILFGRVAYSKFYGKKAIEKQMRGEKQNLNAPPV
jgi:uncharacterized membrane protein